MIKHSRNEAFSVGFLNSRALPQGFSKQIINMFVYQIYVSMEVLLASTNDLHIYALSSN